MSWHKKNHDKENKKQYQMRLQKLSNYSNVKKKTMLEENHLYKNAKGIINIDRNEIKFKFLKASIFSISEKTT